MRDAFSRSMVERAAAPSFVFMTGDLGFNALEPVRAAAGERFVNAGVAEQNMVSVAAALARDGLEVWVYSIAPFLYARACEQIRNDLCGHGLPVKLVGNGGGYGYGVMGPTHHALEDYGVLQCLGDLAVYGPAFDADIAAIVERMGGCEVPAYLRLGREELPAGETAPSYAPWRCLLDGDNGVAVAFGPLAGWAWGLLRERDTRERPELWAACELPLAAAPPPEEFMAALRSRGRLLIMEEHRPQGGFASAMALWLAQRSIAVGLVSLAARGYPSGRYGSQGFHRGESGLDEAGLEQALVTLRERGCRER